MSARSLGVLALLALSALALLLAPLAVDDSYSWIRYGTSESAAQGLEGAWVARLGFLFMGLAVLWLAQVARSLWGRWGYLLFGCFGVMMLGTAAFSHSPWLPGVPSDPVEDLLHTITATTMGFAFAGGVVAVGLRRVEPSRATRAFDLVALLASVAIPLAAGALSAYWGVLQRSMFAIAYLWYGLEAMRAGAEPPTPTA